MESENSSKIRKRTDSNQSTNSTASRSTSSSTADNFLDGYESDEPGKRDPSKLADMTYDEIVDFDHGQSNHKAKTPQSSFAISRFNVFGNKAKDSLSMKLEPNQSTKNKPM